MNLCQWIFPEVNKLNRLPIYAMQFLQDGTGNNLYIYMYNLENYGHH